MQDVGGKYDGGGYFIVGDSLVTPYGGGEHIDGFVSSLLPSKLLPLPHSLLRSPSNGALDGNCGNSSTNDFMDEEQGSFCK